MSAQHYSEDQIFEFATQIILQEKTWPELDFLHIDDKAKVLQLVRMGESALKNRGLSEKSAERKSVKNLLSRDSLSHSHSYRAVDQQKADVEKLSRRVGFSVFPVDLLLKEPELLRRKFFESINRSVSSRECFLLFIDLIEKDREALLKAVSPRLASEIREDLKKGAKNWSEQELNSVYARYSVAVASCQALLEEGSSELQSYIQEYKQNLREHLTSYCQTLPEKYGLLPLLEKLDVQEWRKLAGLTPRTEMALLSFSLPQEYLDKMLQRLPAEQKQDVLDLISIRSKEKQEKVGVFVDILEALKKWVFTVRRLEEASS